MATLFVNNNHCHTKYLTSVCDRDWPSLLLYQGQAWEWGDEKLWKELYIQLFTWCSFAGKKLAKVLRVQNTRTYLGEIEKASACFFVWWLGSANRRQLCIRHAIVACGSWFIGAASDEVAWSWDCSEASFLAEVQWCKVLWRNPNSLAEVQQMTLWGKTALEKNSSLQAGHHWKDQSQPPAGGATSHLAHRP